MDEISQNELTIVQFTWGLRLGGQERVVVDLAKAFQAASYNSMVATTQFEGELAQELRHSGIDVFCFGLKKSYNPFGLPRIINYLKNNHVNVIISHGRSGCLLPKLAGIYLKRPVLIHVEHTLNSGGWLASKRINQLVFNKMDRCVCVSGAVRDAFLSLFQIPSNKLRVIHNGIDTTRFSPNSKKIKSELQRVGIIANFEQAKGHVYFIEAAAQVARVFPNVEFVLVGDGTLRKSMQMLAKEKGLTEQCRFLGRQSDIKRILNQLDIFVLSSIVEGLPISLLEAQALGVPAVATSAGGIPEVITHGENGLLVPPRDAESLASAILVLLQNEKLRATQAVNAQIRAVEQFSLARTSQHYLEEIYTILREKGYDVKRPQRAGKAIEQPA